MRIKGRAQLEKVIGTQHNFWLPALLGGIVFVSGCYAVRLSAAIGAHERDQQTAQVLSTQAAEIERRLSYTLTSTYILAQEIMRAGGRFDEFDEYADSVLQMIPGIANLQLAPKGVIEQIYPLEGNEKAIGHKILQDDARLDEALLAIKSKGLTLAGPFELIQGGVGVIGRQPVFLKVDGTEHFWGFTSALILLEDLVKDLGLQTASESNTHFQLGRNHPGSGKQEIFAGNTSPDFKAHHTINIVVPNGTWFLRAQKQDVGISFSDWMGFLLTLVATLLTFALSNRLIREPARLRKLVAEKTTDLHHIAHHDSLTQLPNRRGFMELLETCIEKANTNQRPLTLMLIDLDLFKEVNDTLGHQMGDLLLQTVAQRLKDYSYKQLALSRWGGDEFIAVLPYDIESPECQQAVECIRKQLAQPLLLAEKEITVSASIGMSGLSDENNDAATLIRSADLAMYETKRTTPGGYTRYSVDIQMREERKLTLKQLLKSAITNNELQLFYQPLVCTKSGNIKKAEALIRWNSPQLGMVHPGELIPVAEDSGLIQEIGDWVFEQATLQVQKWRQTYHPEFQISINVSPTQFRSEDIAKRWTSRLTEIELDTNSILLEITETMILDNSEQTNKQINHLTGAGFQLALDDFGTGYSSLSHLKMLDLSYLKIDRTFIKNLPHSTDDQTLCQAIIAIAKQMQLEVVAEGIESDEQRELLTSLGTEYLQGYLFAKPISADEFEALLDRPSNNVYPLIAKSQ